jgi:hypothetical protein
MWRFLALTIFGAFLSSCVTQEEVVDLTQTHPQRSQILGSFRTIKPLYGYWHDKNGTVTLGTSITTPWYTDEDGVFREHPQKPDFIFPRGTRVRVTGISRHTQSNFPEYIRLTGTIQTADGRDVPMEDIQTYPDRPNRQGPSWR